MIRNSCDVELYIFPWAASHVICPPNDAVFLAVYGSYILFFREKYINLHGFFLLPLFSSVIIIIIILSLTLKQFFFFTSLPFLFLGDPFVAET